MLRRTIGFGSLVLTLAAVGLASCGGGGGGGDAPGGGVVTPPPPPSPTFSSWSNELKPGATVTVTGKGQEITVTGNSNGLTSVSAPSAVGNVTFVETLGANGAITGLQVTTPTRTINFSTASGDTIAANPNLPLVGAATGNLSRGAIAADPSRLGWNYQSFGVWQTQDSSTSGSAGVVSVGAATAASAVPASGSATFIGKVGGLYLEASGVQNVVTGDLTINANFASRSAAFASGALTNITSGASFAGTAISGALTYAAGQNALTGTLTTANGRLSGTATGQFYGPAAQEIGGVFILTPTGGGASFERLGGGFGAKQ